MISAAGAKLNATPTLFLDFDGPLHSAEIQAINRDGEFVPHPDLFSGVPILAVLLKPYPSLQIVVSSDWRFVVTDETLKQILGPLAPRFAGVMEITALSRAQAVKDEARRRGLSAWIAIDDHPTVVEAARKDAHFIACDPIKGIGDLAAQQELVKKVAALCGTRGLDS